MNSNKIITFNVSWFDAIQTLNPETQVKILSAVFNYISTGEEISLEAVEQAIFNIIRLDIDNSSYTSAKSTAPTSPHGPTSEKPAPEESTPEEPVSTQEPMHEDAPVTPANQPINDGKHIYVDKDEYIAPKYQKLITAVEGLPGPIKDLFYRVPPNLKAHHLWTLYYLVKCEEEDNHDYTPTLDNIPDEPEYEPPYIDDDEYVYDYIRPYH